MATLDIATFNRLGQVFQAANAAGVILTIPGTVVTGFVLSNPYGSGKKLILNDAAFVPTTVPVATFALGIATGFSPTAVTHTTPISVYNGDGTGVSSTAVGKVDSSATLPVASVLQRINGYAPTTPATTGGLSWLDQIEGKLILAPGAYAHFTFVGTAPTGISAMSWIEVPV